MRGTWQRKLRTGLLLVAGGLIGGLWIARVTPLRLPIGLVFMPLLALIACATTFWWAWVDERLASGRGPQTNSPRRIASTVSASDARRHDADRGRRAVRVFVGVYAIAVLIPVLMLMIDRRMYDRLPVPVLMWVMVWHISMGVAALGGLGIWVVYLTLHWIGTRGRDRQPHAAGDDPPIDVGRRAFLTGTLTATPLLVVGGAMTAGMREQGRFAVRRIEMHLPRLPDRLRGLTITQVSDFHVGRLFRPEHLPAVVDAVNRLDSDLIAITGDTIDHSTDFLPVACEALRQMHSRHGRFIVIGNHDLIDTSIDARQYLREHAPHFLCDDLTTLDIGGEWIRIIGLDWARHDRGTPADRSDHRGQVARVLAGADPNVFTLALAHHPHAFDALADAGVDLTLAGHTHGGQIMLTPPGSSHPIGGGSLLFRYIWGEYRRGTAALYVNSGVGNWFPLRINAPAEIVQIRLV